jgi:O-antigen/teichoic acid export membrane protein
LSTLAPPLEIAPPAVSEKRGRLAANTLWAFLGQAARTGLHAIYFVVVARALGAEQFGAFASAVAAVAIVGPFASVGAGPLLVKHVARDPRVVATRWGSALVRTLVFGSLLLGVVVLVAPIVLPSSVPFEVIVLVGISDLLFLHVLDISGKAFQAVERLRWTASLEVVLSTARVAAAWLLIVTAVAPSAASWAELYLASTVVAALTAAAAVCWRLGGPAIDGRCVGRELGEGTLFSVSLSAQTVYNDIDKAILARVAGVEAAGIYAAAYRVIDASFTPVRSLLVASYARFFRSGLGGLPATLGMAVPLLVMSALYGAGAVVGLAVAAPALPWLLGDTFRASAEAVRWLAVLPLLKVLHYFAGDALTGAGFQGTRSTGQVAVAGFNVVAALWLVSRYSWRGAAVASVLSDGLLVAWLWLAVKRLARA